LGGDYKVIDVREDGYVTAEEIMPARFARMPHQPIKSQFRSKPEDFILIRKAEDIPDPYAWVKAEEAKRAEASEKKNLVSYGFPEVKDVMKIPKEAKFTATEKLPTSAMTARARRIATLARLDQVTAVGIAKQLGISESTALVELRELERKGLLMEVGLSGQKLERRKKEVKVTEKKKGALDRWVNVV